jgi:hypothetical protein
MLITAVIGPEEGAGFEAYLVSRRSEAMAHPKTHGVPLPARKAGVPVSSTTGSG